MGNSHIYSSEYTNLENYYPQPKYMIILGPFPEGPKYLDSRMSGCHTRNYYYDLGKYPPITVPRTFWVWTPRERVQVPGNPKTYRFTGSTH